MLPQDDKMEPKRAWVAFSAVLVAGVVVAGLILLDLGLSISVVVIFVVTALVLYFYVLYKRYNVEVITENDVMLFDDPDDLRIICSIYGLDATGEPGALRQRLLTFVRAHKDDSFVWVAPDMVLSLGSAITMGRHRAGESSQFANAKPLIGGRPRSESRLSAIDECPVCDAKVPKKGTICPECGADLEFYAALRESRLGKLVLSEKSGSVRRKLRYEVPPLRKT